VLLLEKILDPLEAVGGIAPTVAADQLPYVSRQRARARRLALRCLAWLRFRTAGRFGFLGIVVAFPIVVVKNPRLDAKFLRPLLVAEPQLSDLGDDLADFIPIMILGHITPPFGCGNVGEFPLVFVRFTLR
jgi:hypothetical protein